MGMYLKHECVHKVEIDSEASLFDLHEVIQDAVSFGRDHLFEFFAGRNWRNRKVVFGDGYDLGGGFDTYASVRLEKIYPLIKETMSCLQSQGAWGLWYYPWSVSPPPARRTSRTSATGCRPTSLSTSMTPLQLPSSELAPSLPLHAVANHGEWWGQNLLH